MGCGSYTLNSELLPSPLHGKQWCNGLGRTFTAGNSSETHIPGFTTLNVSEGGWHTKEKKT